MRTTDAVAARIDQAGWRVTELPRTGLVAEIGTDGPIIALRADLDALPVPDLTDDPWTSTVDGVTHACGHDVHTAALVGAAHRARPRCRPRATWPAGSGCSSSRPRRSCPEVPSSSWRRAPSTASSGSSRCTATPASTSARWASGSVRSPAPPTASRSGSTAAAGTPSRPHLTGDLTFALAKVTTELPAMLRRRMDPRAGVSVVWGVVHAGAAPNVIPATAW